MWSWHIGDTKMGGMGDYLLPGVQQPVHKAHKLLFENLGLIFYVFGADVSNACRGRVSLLNHLQSIGCNVLNGDTLIAASLYD